MLLTPDDFNAIEEMIDRILEQKLEEKFKIFRQELYQDFAGFIEKAIMPQLDNHYQRLAVLEAIHPAGKHI